MHFFDAPAFHAERLGQVTFEITSWCNLQCRGCARTIGLKDGTWTNQHMTADTFRKVLGNLPPIECGIIQLTGEPTLNPEFLEICKIAKESGKIKVIHYHTNGITRDVDFLEETTKYVSFFSVSVDTLNEAYVERTRGGTDIEKLKKNIAEIHRRQLPFRIVMVLSRANIMDVPSTLKILNSIGKMGVVIQPFDDDPLKPSYDGTPTPEEMNILRRALHEMRVFIPNIDITFTTAAGDVPKGQICTSPLVNPVVRADGWLGGCCGRLSEPYLMGFADLKEHSFNELLAAENVKNFLHTFLHEPHERCIGCTLNAREKKTIELGTLEAVEEILMPAVNFCFHTNQIEQAENICESFMQKNGLSADALYIYVKILMLRHKFGEALTVLEKITSVIGQNPAVEDLKNKVRRAQNIDWQKNNSLAQENIGQVGDQRVAV